ncbi:hypothetical protein [Dermatobacter hominis]|uniref:hypothetical protein n=1 Tax=Dermatobacter hominis TaxID=2884263 RepID=UPI001D0FDB1E|nr:hypothetical protein [Dermatobacter hominis]UDY36818.1 hypothetical protein LH044_04595 [Dermatobacter hominis]
MSDGRPRPSGDPVAGLDVDRIPPDPAVLIGALGRAAAAVHDGRSPLGSDRASLPRLRPSDAVSVVEAAVAAGWRAPEGSPYAPVEPSRLLAVLGDGLDRVTERATDEVPTIGRATFDNLVLAEPAGEPSLGGSANLTIRRSPRRVPPPTFVDEGDAALSDPYRDLAVAAADVVATFGPGAVLGLTAAYVEARPSIEPLDPVRLDWWSIVAAVTGGRR